MFSRLLLALAALAVASALPTPPTKLAAFSRLSEDLEFGEEYFRTSIAGLKHQIRAARHSGNGIIPIFPEEFIALIESITVDDYEGFKYFSDLSQSNNAKAEPESNVELWSEMESRFPDLHDRVYDAFSGFLARVEKLSENPREVIYEFIELINADPSPDTIRDWTLAAIELVNEEFTDEEKAELDSIFPQITILLQNY